MSNDSYNKKIELPKSLPVDYSHEIEYAFDEVPEKTPRPSGAAAAGARQLRNVAVLAMACVIGFLVMQLTLRVFSRSNLPTTTNDIYKVSTQFRGTDDVDVQQHVTSVVSDNYVMYHVVKPLESAWIVDDFEKSVQIMKIESVEDGRVCYVTHLNRSHSVTPDFYGSQSVESVESVKPKRVQTTFYANDMELEELIHLGSRAVELCSGTPTFWIYPITDKMANAMQTESNHRDKRNVKKCMTSCCIMVCCCNQRYLQWQQPGQKINCHNVCKGCTPLSNTISKEVC